MYITPCVSVCKINKNTNVCDGCGRTINQISNWLRYSDEERMNIMKGLGYGKRTSKENRLVRKATRRTVKGSGKDRE